MSAHYPCLRSRVLYPNATALENNHVQHDLVNGHTTNILACKEAVQLNQQVSIHLWRQSIPWKINRSHVYA